MQQEFGKDRIFNAPIAEDYIIGTANGMSRFNEKIRIVVEGAEFAEETGKQIEIVDIRSIIPLDKDAILESVKKTNRALIVHEDKVFGGFGGELVSIIADEAFTYLDAPVKRIGSTFTPVGFNPTCPFRPQKQEGLFPQDISRELQILALRYYDKYCIKYDQDEENPTSIPPPPKDSEYHNIDIKGLEIEDAKEFGAAHLCKQMLEMNSERKELYNCEKKITHRQLYSVTDILYKHKPSIDKYLYNRITDMFEIEDKLVIFDLRWTITENKIKDDKSKGVYFIRTNYEKTEEAELWDIYNTIREVESTFRSLKSDLNLRPGQRPTALH